MRIKKAIVNSVTSLLYQIILIISGLIVPRLILLKYGSDCNGVVSAASQFMSVVSLLIIGLTAATRVEFYQSLSRNDYERTGKILYTTKKYTQKVAYILTIYVVCLALLFPFFLKTSLDRTLITMLVLSVGVGSFFEYYIGLPYRILLQADQRHYIENILASISCIAYTILAIMLIYNGYSLVAVKLTAALISLVVMLVIAQYANKKYRLQSINGNEIIQLPLRRDAAIHSVANIVHQNSDIVMLTIFTDAKTVSVYTVYYFVAGQIKKLIASFTEGLESAFGNIWAKKEIAILKERFRQYEFIISFIVLIIFGCTAILLIPFVTLYTKGVSDTNYILPRFSLLMVITETVYCMRQPYVTIIQAAGKYKETRNIAIVEASVNVITSAILVWKLGLIGVLIGTLSANLIRTIYYIYYSYRYILKEEISEAINILVWFLATYSVMIYILKVIVNHIEITSWLRWVVTGLITFLFAIVISTVSSLLFHKKEFMGIILLIKNVIIKKKDE